MPKPPKKDSAPLSDLKKGDKVKIVRDRPGDLANSHDSRVGVRGTVEGIGPGKTYKIKISSGEEKRDVVGDYERKDLELLRSAPKAK
jgi:ribosomal protein L21E